MSSHSILFREEPANVMNIILSEQPLFFADLNLDQMVNVITTGKEEYNLKPFFYTHLQNVNAIKYRQEIMKDVEKPSLFEYFKSFADKMRNVRHGLTVADQCSYTYQKERIFLDTVESYCKSISSFTLHLSQADLTSGGLMRFHQYLLTYVQSDLFNTLLSEVRNLESEFGSISYCIVNKDLRVQVRACNGESDLTVEVKQLFAKFNQSEVKSYLMEFDDYLEINHVEASILDGVAELFPELFQRLDEFYKKYTNFQDKTILIFDRELQFYISYLEYIEKIKKAGLNICYPEISNTCKEVFANQTFDLALASKLTTEKSTIVCNDFYLNDPERILVVTGPNQGGKTTTARTFGQLHFLAGIGCPVPGVNAKLFLYDRLFTHFEKEENIQTMRSKFEDDLYRIHSILKYATSNSIVIMNEILSSTSLQDAILLSKKIIEKISSLDCLCVWVTFIDELSTINKKTVSMSSTVEAENPASRTFKVVRKKSDGLAYALSIAEKYKVTYTQLKDRINL